MADSKLCEVYLAVKNKAIIINNSTSSEPIVVDNYPVIINKW